MERDTNRGEEAKPSKTETAGEKGALPSEKPVLRRTPPPGHRGVPSPDTRHLPQLDESPHDRGRREALWTAAQQEQQAEPGPASAGEQSSGSGEQQTVFDRVAKLEHEVAELRAKQDRQRELANARWRRWRKRHLEKSKEETRERMRALREARKRQEGGQ